MELTTTDILLIALVVQCLGFAIALLLTHRGKRSANTFLSTLLFVFSVQMAFNMLDAHDVPGFYYARSLSLTYGPLIWFFSRSISDLNFEWTQQSFLHLLPTVIAIIVSLFVPVSGLWISFLSLVSFGIYAISSMDLLTKTHTSLKQVLPSGIARFPWTYELLVAIIVVIVVGARADVLHTELQFNALIIVLFLVINFIGFRGVLKPYMFMGVVDSEQLAAQDIRQKYRNSSLTKTDLEIYSNRIEEIMDSQRPYLDSELTLNSFAELVELSPRVVSQVVNQSFDRSFSDYINDHRLERAKHFLATKSAQEMNVSEIIDASGFNSKTRFYTFFKKQTGLSPKEYRAEQRD